MKDFLKAFLTDEKGQPSLARLIPFMFSVALLYDWMVNVKVPDWKPDFEILALIGASLGFKVWQKWAEK